MPPNAAANCIPDPCPANMVPEEEIRELIDLYGRFHSAIDPMDPVVVAAEEQFFRRIGEVHQAHSPDVEFSEFRRHVVMRAKEYLRKN